MELNHINLTVTDVKAAKTFLETYFGLRDMGGNAGMGFMSDDDEFGFVLSFMRRGKGDQVIYPANFHIGFFREERSDVDEVYRRLKDDGYDVPPPEQSNHAYGFYVDAPGGFTVELGA